LGFIHTDLIFKAEYLQMEIKPLSPGARRLWAYILILAIVQGCQPEEEPGPLLVVETGTVKELGPTHCTLQGEILETDLGLIKQHGFVWSEIPDPSLETGSFTQLGTTYGPGVFSSTIRNLSPETVYYIKAYASDETQTEYGGELEVTTTSPVIPTLYSSQAYHITATSAVSGGAILSDGGLEITARGVCWSAHHTPTIHDDHTVDGTGSGSFESELTGLESYTVYFLRAYATNSLGTGYGENFAFITLWDNSPVEDIDGNVYSTFQLGDNVWMAENLKVIHFSDGTPIDHVENSADWNNLGIDSKAYSFYENSDSSFAVFGGLYTWAAAMNGEVRTDNYDEEIQGVCPEGWHLPTESEWKQLEQDLGMSELDVRDKGWRGWTEGGKLKQTGTSLWIDPNEGATNESGFTALPGGMRAADGVFSSRDTFAAYWSSTGFDSQAWIRALHADNAKILREEYPVNSGLSVRCVMDW
jgi:uncharacterized protein (TIGR02145 family)